jgi:hypothetical protein
MLEQHSAEEIGQYNYTHWTDKPITPGIHTIATVPQTIADGWEAYCSCGQWRGFCSIYDVYEAADARKATFDALQAAFEKHVAVSRS